MYWRYVRDALDRAAETVTGSHIARAHAGRAREAWRVWRALWATLETEPPDERLVAVCMYCERIRADTGEWIAPPPELAEMLRDRRVVQLTHGACPLCLAGHLGD